MSYVIADSYAEKGSYKEDGPCEDTMTFATEDE